MTYLATNIFAGDGASTHFDFVFAGVSPDASSGTTPYLYPEDVKALEIYTDISGAAASAVRTVTIDPALPNRAFIAGPAVAEGRQIKIYRSTEIRFPLVDYRDLQTVSELDLDLSARQAIFVAQETQDAANNNPLTLDALDNYDAKHRRLVNLAPGVNPTDAVNLNQLTRAIRIPATEPALAELPNAADRAGKLLAFDANGLPYMTIPVSGTAADLEARLAFATDPTKGANMIGTNLFATGSVGGNLGDKIVEWISPYDFGCVGDGVADDGPGLNLMLNYARERINAAAGGNTIVHMDLGSKTYKTTVSLNFTKMAAGWSIAAGTIVGHCTGKAIVDAIGTRDGGLRNLMIIGDKVNRPSCGIQTCRGLDPAYGFCDGFSYFDVRIRGYFSKYAIYAYGQEGTVYLHCKFWNSDHTAGVAFHSGYDTYTVTSDYTAPSVGAVSYINDKYINCDWMHLPLGGFSGITGISKSTSAVFTVPGHEFVIGDVVVMNYINGMTQMNNLKATITAVTANTVTTNINSTAFSTYVSSGSMIRAQQKPTVYFGRGQQHHFDTCYIVNYGSDAIEFDMPEGFPLDNIKMNILFEGAGTRSLVRFLSTGTVMGFDFETYNVVCKDHIFSCAPVSGNIALTDARIRIANSVWGVAPSFLENMDRFSLYGCEISSYQNLSNLTLMQDRIVGTVRSLGTGKVVAHNLQHADYRSGTALAAVFTTGGGLGNASAQVDRDYNGNHILVSVLVSVVTAGGSGAIRVQMPFTVNGDYMLSGAEVTLNGKAVRGIIPAGGSIMDILYYDGTSPIQSGTSFKLSGVVRIAN